MDQPTTDPCPSAASVLFNLPDYHVAGVNRDGDGHRPVVIATPAVETPCPECGVNSTRVINAPGNDSRTSPSTVT